MENILNFWPLGLLLIAVGMLKVFVEPILKKSKSETNLSQYEKKQYLFDSNAEFALYKILLELFGQQYHIFPQINYSHLIKPKTTDRKEKQALRSRIDRKSADFVICDIQTAVPLLVIELDGKSHEYEKQKIRDENINNLCTEVGLPILHLPVTNLDKDFIRAEITKKLSPSSRQNISAGLDPATGSNPVAL